VGKVDHAQDAIHHRIAERDQGVNAALRQTKDDEIQPLLGRVFAAGEGDKRTVNNRNQKRGADQPEDIVGKIVFAAQVREHRLSPDLASMTPVVGRH
jgi:hypothetical protein